MLFDRVLFLVFGEIFESEKGLEKVDIDLIVGQFGIDRNFVIRILRKIGNVFDVIIEIGNM